MVVVVVDNNIRLELDLLLLSQLKRLLLHVLPVPPIVVVLHIIGNDNGDGNGDGINNPKLG